MPAQGKLELNAFLEDTDPLFVEAVRQSTQHPAVDIRGGLATPERERRAQAADRVVAAALRGAGGGIGGEPFEVRDIERSFRDVDRIAGRRRADELVGPQLTKLPPESGYAGLDLALRGSRRLAVPQCLDDPAERYCLSPIEQEQGYELSLSATAELDCLAPD